MKSLNTWLMFYVVQERGECSTRARNTDRGVATTVTVETVPPVTVCPFMQPCISSSSTARVTVWCVCCLADSSTQRRHLPSLRPETPSTSSKGARSLGAPGRRPRSTGSILRSLRGHDARKLATCRRHSSILKVGGKAALRISWSEKVAEKERKAAIKTKEKELLAAKKDRYAVMNPCISFKIKI